ncbi:MAG: adenosine kinase [Hyphomicrobiales bacterium]
MAKILGIGNALVDVMTRLEDDALLEKLDLPKGSMQLVDETRVLAVEEACQQLERSLASGGSAANTIHGLANLGVDSAFIGKVGKDKLGKFFEDHLEKSSINPKLIYSDNQSGRAVALVSKDSERTFATFLGAAVELSSEDLYPEMFEGYDILHVEGYLVQNHDLLEAIVILAKNEDLKISLDLASFNVVEDNLSFLQKIVRDYVDIVFANEEEAKAFTGAEPQEALEILANQTDIAVVKLGEKGSIIMHEDRKFGAGIIKADCIDTTAAGDYYAAGFLYGLINNKTLDICGQIGAILSGNVIEVLGANMDKERWSKIKALVEKY